MASSKFHHEEIYRGKDLTAKLRKRRLFVCGAGALGSNLIDALIREGFSNLAVIDKDRIESHNINTQIYGARDVGALKADTLKNTIFRNVEVEIEAISKELTVGNVKALLKKADIVVDVFDNTASRQLIQDECRRQKIKCIHAGLFSDYGEVIWDEKYKVPKDSDGDVCDYPLARNLVSIVVAVLAEELLDYCLAEKPRLGDWTITLKDLAVKRMV